MLYGLIGLIIASGLLTWLTKPLYEESLMTRQPKKHKTKNQLRDAQPYLTEDGFVGLHMNPDRLTNKPEQSAQEP